MTTTTAERPVTGNGSDFAELSRRINRAGLLTRRPGYYAVRLGLVAAAYVGGWATFVLVGASWWTLAVAVFQAVVFAQVALVAHDLAHRQVFGRNRPSERAGLVAGNLGIGMSYGYWMVKHSRHHANPNHDELDPDVGPGVLVWSREAARGRGFLTAYQAFFFLPLLTLLGVSLKKDSVAALSDGTVKRPRLEGGLLAVHAVVYLSALFTVLAPLQAVAFLVVHQALFGIYLGLTFAPNHKGMPHPDGTEDFLRKQVLTSRNVRGGRLVDAALGGLNHQIEHHLFPAMPTPNLRRAGLIVRAYCAELGVPYEATGPWESYARGFRHLHDVGAELRQERRAVGAAR